jgi:DMSO/TMAO reductase YedYZ heme-binding membrane subunit
MSVLAAGPSPFWYLTRGAGTVAMLLLTASVVLGIVDFSRWRTAGWPRFLTDALHRNVSMLALVMVVIHVITTVADGFAPIGLQDAIVPFLSPYRPLWLGLGALSFDLLVAVAITSALRRHVGYRAWRAVHWSAYACWPLAILHGLGTGTDASAAWMLLLTVACLAAVLLAVGWRVTSAPPTVARRLAAAALLVGPVALIVWSASGPLGGNWAARAGTPPSLLASLGPASAVSTGGNALDPPFTARLAGSVHEGVSADSSLATVRIQATMSGGAKGPLNVTITGQPLAGGGVAMTQGTISVGTRDDPNLYAGHVVALHGSQVVGTVSSQGDQALRLTIGLSIDQTSGSVTGTVHAQEQSGG